MINDVTLYFENQINYYNKVIKEIESLQINMQNMNDRLIIQRRIRDLDLLRNCLVSDLKILKGESDGNVS